MHGSKVSVRHTVLQKMKNITGLALEWSTEAERFVDGAEVLRELEPPPPCSVSEFWSDQNLHASRNCNHLPPLGKLLNLRWLEIRRMDSVKKFNADLYGGPGTFPRVE